MKKASLSFFTADHDRVKFGSKFFVALLSECPKHFQLTDEFFFKVGE